MTNNSKNIGKGLMQLKGKEWFWLISLPKDFDFHGKQANGNPRQRWRHCIHGLALDYNTYYDNFNLKLILFVMNDSPFTFIKYTLGHSCSIKWGNELSDHVLDVDQFYNELMMLTNSKPVKLSSGIISFISKWLMCLYKILDQNLLRYDPFLIQLDSITRGEMSLQVALSTN